jgi:hypothetical protein
MILNKKMCPKIKRDVLKKNILPKRDLMEGLLDFVLFFFNSADIGMHKKVT